MSSMTLKEMVELTQRFEEKLSKLPSFNAKHGRYGIDLAHEALKNAEKTGTKPSAIIMIVKHYHELCSKKPDLVVQYFNTAMALYQQMAKLERPENASLAIKRARPAYTQLVTKTKRGHHVDYSTVNL